MPTAPVSLMPALRRVIAGRAAERSDADLLAAFVDDRDPEAFAALVRRHGPMVLGVCRRVVRDADAADDAFQAVFLVLARRAGDVRPRARVGGWLYGVAYKTALKARAVRARRRTRESQVDAFPEPAAPPAADGWDDLKPVLDEELARLPDRLRVPVVLCDLEGRPQRAVAGQLGIAPATLAGRLADARRTLAARLTRRGVALAAPALAALLAGRAAAGVVNPRLAAGVVKAAEAVAAGGAAAGLVSANALQLCDGVMRMIFLTKLKTAAASAVAVLVVAGAVGPGLRPAVAQDGGAAPAAAKAGATAAPDAAFLDRICLELRGSKATPVEHAYFAADADADKRHKVTNWLLADPRVKAHLGGGADRHFGLRLTEQNFETTADGELRSLSVAVKDHTAGTPAAKAVAFSPDGKQIAVERSAEATWVEVYDADTGKQKTEYHRVRPAADPTVVGEITRFLGAGREGRVEVVTDADAAPAKKAEPAKAGEPVRMKVVVASDDGKGGVKYKVEERLAFTPKKTDGKEPPPQAFYYKLVTPTDGPAPGTFLYRVTPSGQVERVEGNAVVRDTLLLARPPGKDAKAPAAGSVRVWDATAAKETDAAFLRRAVTEARGTPPTALEERYFAADPDPRKREKLLDALLSDPAALRRVGDGWKRRMLAPPAAATWQPQVVPFTPQGTADFVLPYLRVQPKGGKAEVAPLPPAKDVLLPKQLIELDFVPVPGKDVIKGKGATPPTTVAKAATARLVAGSGDRWSRLVADLISVGKTDEQMLEALTLAAAGRLPTDVEKRLARAAVPASGDRAAAWAAVARALAGPAAQPQPAPPPLPKSKQ